MKRPVLLNKNTLFSYWAYIPLKIPLISHLIHRLHVYTVHYVISTLLLAD
jgi:hypothetical protein